MSEARTEPAAPAEPGDSARPAAAPRLPGSALLVLVPDAAAAAAAAADLVVAGLRDAVAERGRADWATTGGSIATPLYHEIRRRHRDSVDWGLVHLWWGDDRYVPRDHLHSNALPAEQVLLSAASLGGRSGIGATGMDTMLGRDPAVEIPAWNVHAIPIGRAIGRAGGPAMAATDYEAELRAEADQAPGLLVAEGWPAFDVLLLGVGPDGHVLSVFPGSPAWESEAWAIPIDPPTHVGPHVSRVSLNPAVVRVAHRVVVVAAGAEKAEGLAEAVGAPADTHALPVRATFRRDSVLVLDEAAAASLPR
jgi:6-phosphogluconolactonase